jgi:uncharacterized protein YcbK (DUF882 family)
MPATFPVPRDPAAPSRGRRRFLGALAFAGASALCGTRAFAAAPARELGFLNLHTGERLRLPYWEAGSYLRDALAEIDHVLRDHRANAVHAIDLRLLDLLSHLQGVLGSRREFEVISGYRAPSTNAMLRARSTGVSRGSLHLQGKAIDIRLPGVDLARLHLAAVSLRGGGVGLYRASNFIHVDTGRVRYW